MPDSINGPGTLLPGTRQHHRRRRHRHEVAVRVNLVLLRLEAAAVAAGQQEDKLETRRK